MTCGQLVPPIGWVLGVVMGYCNNQHWDVCCVDAHYDLIMTLLSIVVLKHVGTLLSSRCTVPVARLTFNS